MLASFQVRPQAQSEKLENGYSFIEDWAGNGYRRQGEWGTTWIKSDSGSFVQVTHGSGSTTEKDALNIPGQPKCNVCVCLRFCYVVLWARGSHFCGLVNGGNN
jgi:hypothetical protein